MNCDLSKLEISNIRIRLHEVCPHGVLLVDWSHPDLGFGRWEMYLDAQGIPHAETEFMDKGSNKEFSAAIFKAILNGMVIES